MLTVDHYASIRLAHRDGMSIREIARSFGHSRRKVRAVLAQSQPVPYTRTKPPPAPVLGDWHPTIDAILVADEEAPPKQRHTAMQVFRRLRDEHAYRGSYSQVRRYVARQRRSHKQLRPAVAA
jgi:transposase